MRFQLTAGLVWCVQRQASSSMFWGQGEFDDVLTFGIFLDQLHTTPSPPRTPRADASLTSTHYLDRFIRFCRAPHCVELTAFGIPSRSTADNARRTSVSPRGVRPHERRLSSTHQPLGRDPRVVTM